MKQFIFEQYDFDVVSGQAHFTYRFDDGRVFEEVVSFTAQNESYDTTTLDKALFLAFIIIGTSYFKTFPTSNISFQMGEIDAWQAHFLNKVYNEGLSQFAFENNLQPSDLASFKAHTDKAPAPTFYEGVGIIALQSGGKDSLLTAALLRSTDTPFVPWYVSSSGHYPNVLNGLGEPLIVATRRIDASALQQATAAGGKNGHVPVTYIIQSLALIQSILLGKSEVLVSIAHEGEEPHAFIGDLPVTHQWSKTWQAEQLFSEYVTRYISPKLKIGSPLRGLSELKVAELFVRHAWTSYGHRFSSCNRANYGQGSDNTELQWCGECPKCANSFLLFAPFVSADELTQLFGGQDLFNNPMLQETFKGLLGIDGVMKPFECIGEIDELRYAYHAVRTESGYKKLSFDVPPSNFVYETVYPSQDWARFSDDLLQ